MYDGVVVGGGIVGLFSACALQERGLKIAIVDDGKAGQASIAAGGILSPLYPWRAGAAVSRLLNLGLRLYRPLLADMRAAQPPTCLRPGLLYLSREEEDRAKVWAEHHNWPLHVHKAAELRELEPRLAASSIRHGGFSLPSVQCLSASALLIALRAIAKKKADVYRQEALDIVIKNRRVRGVQLEKRIVKTSCVIVCAGAWTVRLLPSLNAIQPVRGQMINYAAHNMLNHIVIDRESYLIPHPDGGLVAGSTVEKAGFRPTATTAAKQKLNDVACGLVPELKGAAIVKHWAGLRPGIDRQEPVIARHPDVEGLFAHSGHFRNGISLAPASAQLLAQMVCEEPSDMDCAPYAWPKR